VVQGLDELLDATRVEDIVLQLQTVATESIGLASTFTVVTALQASCSVASHVCIFCEGIVCHSIVTCVCLYVIIAGATGYARRRTGTRAT